MIEVEIEDPAWTVALNGGMACIERAGEAALAAAQSGKQASLCVLLTDDETVRDLNARFRHKPGATNVLSFPAPPSAHPHLGDVALAFGVCAEEARTQGKLLADHLSHLLVHGVLHLVGYDHESEAQAEVMEDMERDILRGLGVADPYARRDTDGEL